MALKTPLIVATAGVFLLTACDPYPQGNPDNQRARTGALTGALIGGAVGASAGSHHDRGLKTLAGAAIGAAVGGAIGTSLDQQAADLRRDVGNPNIGIVNTGNELVVTMPQDILFATDSAAVRADLQNDLRAVARNLQQYPNTRVEVIGHTDNTGSAGYNQDLSQRRASAVASVLVSAGVPSSRVAAYGRGEDQPVASNLTAEGRTQNRRVEIIIRPIS
ncbi:OmpA family protein [Ruixingdingia sedimenti]|uniref:OmpA family protein n=1 Tax=Ruixingdingia sedimenti TaxID=3073604 RepID=A0ABU1F9S1_9RHOB|nr:OmpA family protein [Xinfangfangia sp. LG-4]MDR5653629.1 OmpA family protein [Xinfangfangia sp. LG-4]